MEKRPEKHVKTGHAGTQRTPPVVPLKNLQNADQQAAKDPRDTPLVRKRTVADI